MNAENMAWFEVEHLILGANETHKPMVGESTSHNSAKLQLGERGEHRQGSLKLLVQYNPAGIIFLNTSQRDNRI